MNWQEKFAAIKRLSRDANLEMRKPGDWYVSCGLMITHDTHFCKGANSDGRTPKEAVKNLWDSLMNVPDGETIEVRVRGGHRYVRWMDGDWRSVPRG